MNARIRDPKRGVAKRPLATPGHENFKVTHMCFRRSQSKRPDITREGSQAGMANGHLATPTKRVKRLATATPKGGVA